MPKIKVVGQTVQIGEHRQDTDRRTDGRYQFHNLPASLKLRGRLLLVSSIAGHDVTMLAPEKFQEKIAKTKVKGILYELREVTK